MDESVELQVARVVDLDALKSALDARGIEAEPLDEEALGFRIPVEDGGAELMAQLEHIVAESGLPLVPQRGDGFVYLRPPGD